MSNQPYGVDKGKRISKSSLNDHIFRILFSTILFGIQINDENFFADIT